MLAAQIGEKLGGGSGTPCLYILVTVPDALSGFCEVLALPLEIDGQSIVEGRGRILSPPFGILFQLRLTLRLEWDDIRVGLSFLPFILRGSAAEVKSYLGAKGGTVKCLTGIHEFFDASTIRQRSSIAT
jgi:hypothetical protein